VKAERFRAAGLGMSRSTDVRFRLSVDLLGLKYDYVTGYRFQLNRSISSSSAMRPSDMMKFFPLTGPLSDRRW
jgi:hypothetical protein